MFFAACRTELDQVDLLDTKKEMKWHLLVWQVKLGDYDRNILIDPTGGDYLLQVVNDILHNACFFIQPTIVI